MQNNSNRNTIHLNHTEQRLTQEGNKNECKDYRENYEEIMKEDYLTISKKPRLEKSQGR